MLHYTSDTDNSPETTIRSDLWPTMSLTQLTNQQDLVINRINKLTTMMGQAYTESIRNIYGVLQQANKDLANLIDHKSRTEK